MKKRLGISFYPFMVLLLIVVAYFPIAFQLLSLKNDIIQLDLPVKLFISKEIHRGQLPIWMYSWAGGFPLGHLFSWSIYNPITLFFATVFKYDLSVLHLEYLCYLIIGASGIYKICKQIFLLTSKSSAIAALVYVLSGITVSCSQFMAYIASIAILPWLFYCFILLIKKPSIQTCLNFALSTFLLVSWSYPAGIIISFYSLLALAFLAHSIFDFDVINKKFFGFLLLSITIIVALSLPLIYTTVQTLPFFSRSEKLTGLNNDFGYLHPSSLLTFFNPFHNISIPYADTTFLFQNVNIGIVGLSFLIAGLWKNDFHGTRKKVVMWLIIGAIIAIVFSFGDIFFLRGWINEILPGFKWFRFPSFFRIFFLLSASIIIGILFDQKAKELANGITSYALQRVVLVLCCSIACLLSFYQLYQSTFAFSNILPHSFFFNNGGLQKSIALLFFVWTIIILVIALFKKEMMFNISKLVIADLILTAILSLPIYAVSNYTPQQMQTVLRSKNTWSERITIDHSTGVYIDKKGNPFNGLNVYANKINIADQYWGPLHLKSYPQLKQSEYIENTPPDVIFLPNQNEGGGVKMRNNTFENHTFSAQVSTKDTQKVILFQLAFPFWKGYIDNRQVSLLATEEGLVYINVEGGQHEVKFIYQDSLLSIFNLVFFITFPALILAIILLKWRSSNV